MPPFSSCKILLLPEIFKGMCNTSKTVLKESFISIRNLLMHMKEKFNRITVLNLLLDPKRNNQAAKSYSLKYCLTTMISWSQPVSRLNTRVHHTSHHKHRHCWESLALLFISLSSYIPPILLQYAWTQYEADFMMVKPLISYKMLQSVYTEFGSQTIGKNFKSKFSKDNLLHIIGSNTS